MLGVFVGEVSRSLRRRAKERLALKRVADARTGAVTFIQRLDSVLRLNVHFPEVVPEPEPSAAPPSRRSQAPFGPGFVAAFVSVAVDGTEAIELQVFDAGGAEVAATTLPAPGATGALGIVPARTGDQLLVGWASAPSPGAPRALQVARVACEAP